MGRAAAVTDTNLREWVADAACGAHLELPWLEPDRITSRVSQQMTEICYGCPVLKRCAAEALHLGPPGGFYAGVRVPWFNKINKQARTSARRRLRAVIEYG